jgi:peptide/nickel transport system permease protein
MTTYIIRRLIQTVFVLLIITILCFSLLHIIPGDPVMTLLGANATMGQIEEMRAE